jgi:hypothetical protein
MIKIQQHLNRDDADEYLDSLATSMWDQLNKIDQDGNFNQFSLVKKLERLISKTNEGGYLDEYADANNDALKRQKKFLHYLSEYENAKLKELIIGRPESLVILKIEILAILNQSDLFYTHQGQYKQTSFGKLLNDDLFNYTNFRNLQFCRELMLKAGYQDVTCPYCNDNRINIIDISSEEDKDIILRAYFDLDHFFSKSQNPFFAISFYNLIPSCHSCNSTEKGNLIFNLHTHTNPYFKSFNENYLFEINQDSTIFGATDVIHLNYIGESQDYNKRDFKLQERYQKIHLNTVNTFIKHYLNYQHYRECGQFYQGYTDILLENVPINENEILKKTTGKMYRDVLNQIDIFDLLS